METLSVAWALLHGWVFEVLVEPVVFALGLSTYMEMAFDATEFFLVGAVEIAILAVVLSALERYKPVEVWADRSAMRVDVIYTLLSRLGVAPLFIFVVLTPVVDSLDGWLRMQGMVPWKLEDAVPALHANPLASFVVYLVILDFVAYWLHRAQHRFEFWWALHSLHHSQRVMTFWADDRNHLLDDIFVDACFAVVALAIGVPPAQFVLVIAATRVVESLSHANVRLAFGRWGERLLVSPRFHRVHHAIGVGHEGEHRGCNFAVLFPVWDHVFGTANTKNVFPATGVRDQLHGRDYGEGFWRQQALGLARFARSFRRPPARSTLTSTAPQ
jgi:sterol desaturase/sphingolipid hydroxylase (fatty acid hydroxylase superfamily)